MPKKIILITAGIAVLLLIFGAIFWIRSRNNQPVSDPTPNPTDEPIFTATPTPDVPLVVSVCPNAWVGQPDGDQDGLPDTVETNYQTNPNVADTDSDNYKDGEEVRNGYDPLKPGSVRLDSDSDELLEHEECKWGTDPFNPDTDGDGYKDGNEVKNGYNPLISGNARIDANTPTPIPTPTPSGLILGTPTPFAYPTPTPNPQNTPIPTPAQLTKITRADLVILKTNTNSDLKTYLSKFDQMSPNTLVGGDAFSNALIAAFKGNSSQLNIVLADLKKYEQNLLKLPTPETAVNHQILIVSLTRAVNQQLTIISQQAGIDASKQFAAASALQQILSSNLNTLKSERQKLDALVK